MARKALPIPSKKELEKAYPKHNLAEAGKIFGVGQTLFFKWLKSRGIPTTKIPRVVRSDEHKTALSKSLSGKRRPNRLTGKILNCAVCGGNFYRQKTHITSESSYCSYKCMGASKKVELAAKICLHCNVSFTRGDMTAGNYRAKKYCSKSCARSANPPPTFLGEKNPRWKRLEARRKHRHGPKRKWRNAVLSRDKATCQNCGQKNIGLVVHHIKPWETHPELRFEISNGLKLSQKCHFVEHGYDSVKDGIKEHVDARGVLQRTWTGHCLNCNSFLVRTASDMKRADGTIRKYAFCSRTCQAKLGKNYV